MGLGTIEYGWNKNSILSNCPGLSFELGLLRFPSKNNEMAAEGNEFDFTPRNVYGQEVFNKTVVRGPGDVRQVVEAELAKNGEAYLACLMGLSKDG